MKAIVYTKYRSPDVLQLKEVEKLAPGDDKVLVKIHAAAANLSDWQFMRIAAKEKNLKKKPISLQWM